MTRGRVINSRHGFSGEAVDVLYIDHALDSKGKVGSDAKHENIPPRRCSRPNCLRSAQRKARISHLQQVFPPSGLCCRTLFYMIKDQFRISRPHLCSIHPHPHPHLHPFSHPFFISSSLDPFDISLVLFSISIFQNVRMTAGGERQMITVPFIHSFIYLFIFYLLFLTYSSPAFPPPLSPPDAVDICTRTWWHMCGWVLHRGDVYVYADVYIYRYPRFRFRALQHRSWVSELGAWGF